MRSIFIVLAIVIVLEVGSIHSRSLDENNANSNLSTMSPDQLVAQIATVVDRDPSIIQAVSDLPSEKIAQMAPHLEALANTLKENPIRQLIVYLYNACAQQENVRRVMNAYQHIEQLVQRTAGHVPIIIKQKTNLTFVYPNSAAGGSTVGASPPSDDASNDSAYAREATAAGDRIGREVTQNLEQVRAESRAAQAQIEQDVAGANELLRNRMRESFLQTKQEMRNTMNAMRLELQKAHEGMKKAFAWMRADMSKQLWAIQEELERSKRAHKADVEGFKAGIRDDLATTRDTVQQQLTEASDELKQRLGSATGLLNSQLDAMRNQASADVQRASDALDAQLRDIHARVATAIDEMRNEMRAAEEELRRGITEAYGGATGGGVDRQTRQEMENAIAEMKSTTQEMREKMEREIQNAVHALTSEIESILAEMRKANPVAAAAATTGDRIAGDGSGDSGREANSAANERAGTAGVVGRGLNAAEGVLGAAGAVTKSPLTGEQPDADDDDVDSAADQLANGSDELTEDDEEDFDLDAGFEELDR